MKSDRNKTIDITIDQGGELLSRCLRPQRALSESEALDSTIIGNSFEALPLLPDAIADLVVADPPYNLRKNFGGSVFSEMSAGEYLSYTRRWLSLIRPKLKDTGSIYVCCDWRCSGEIERALREFFIVRNRITWQREKGRGANKNWKNSMEDIWFATVSDEYVFYLDAVKQRRRCIAPYRSAGAPKDWEETENGRFRDTCPSNFWDDITVPYWSMAENTPHPTQKPEKLLAKLILASCPPGGVVLDPFLGSGSTSVTAKKLGRHYIGVEQNEQYALWCEYRLKMADSDNTIQGFSDGVFWERNSAPKRK